MSLEEKLHFSPGLYTIGAVLSFGAGFLASAEDLDPLKTYIFSVLPAGIWYHQLKDSGKKKAFIESASLYAGAVTGIAARTIF